MHEQGGWDEEGYERGAHSQTTEMTYAAATTVAAIVVLMALMPILGLLYRIAHLITWYLLATPGGGEVFAIQLWWLIPSEWLLFVGEVAMLAKLGRPVYRRVRDYFLHSHDS